YLDPVLQSWFDALVSKFQNAHVSRRNCTWLQDLAQVFQLDAGFPTAPSFRAGTRQLPHIAPIAYNIGRGDPGVARSYRRSHCRRNIAAASCAGKLCVYFSICNQIIIGPQARTPKIRRLIDPHLQLSWESVIAIGCLFRNLAEETAAFLVTLEGPFCRSG